jgi:hypothetical protein
MTMNFGYRIDLERRADLESTATRLPAGFQRHFRAPEEIDPRPWHRIEDQGEMGSCQGHALSSVCEMAYHIATGEVIQFSPLFAYYATQKIDGIRGDQGSTIDGGRRCAMEFGSCPLDVMPYPNPVRYRWEIPKEAYEAAKAFKIRSHTMIRSYQDAFTFLASGQGGIEIGIGWGDLQTDSRGVIETYRPGPGGHAVCFLGYSKRSDRNSEKYLWLANSWGPQNWGNAGWAEVSPTAVRQMLQARDTVMVGLSDLTTPTARKIDWAKEPLFS